MTHCKCKKDSFEQKYKLIMTEKETEKLTYSLERKIQCNLWKR